MIVPLEKWVEFPRLNCYYCICNRGNRCWGEKYKERGACACYFFFLIFFTKWWASRYLILYKVHLSETKYSAGTNFKVLNNVSHEADAKIVPAPPSFDIKFRAYIHLSYICATEKNASNSSLTCNAQ